MNPAELYTQLATQAPKRETPIVEPEDNFVLPELTEAEEKELGDYIQQAYSMYEELPPAQKFVAEVAPGTGEAISAYETKKFFEETKDAIKEGKFGEAALKGGLTALAGLGTIPLAGKGIQVAKAAAKRLPELTSIENIKKILKQNNKPATEMNMNKIADEIGESKEYINPNFVPKGQEPKNSFIGYKLFRKKADGNIYPLYVDTKNPIPTNQWMKADKGFYFKDSKGIKRQPALTGDYQPIPDKKTADAIIKAGYEVTKTEKAIARAGKGLSKTPFAARMSVKYRPGWHGDTMPNASHLAQPGSKSKEGAKRVWAEVEFSNDKDYTDIVNKRGINPETGKFDSKEADIDYVPEGGTYRYKTNPNMEGAWLIGGEMKVNRVLDLKEVNQIRKDLKKRGTK
jgi:hypothetical protein